MSIDIIGKTVSGVETHSDVKGPYTSITISFSDGTEIIISDINEGGYDGDGMAIEVKKS